MQMGTKTICIYPPGNDLLFLCTVSLKIPVRYSPVQTTCDSESRWPCYHHLVTLLTWHISEIFNVAELSPGLHHWSALACRLGVCAPNNFPTHLLLDFYFSKENRINIAVCTENGWINIPPSEKYFLVLIMYTKHTKNNSVKFRQPLVALVSETDLLP